MAWRLKRPPAMQETQVQSLGWEDPLEKEMATPVFLPGESHGWRSLVGYSPRGCKESDMTERLHFHFRFHSTGEGNGNPFQYYCLENPRDRGVHGVAKSQTQLSD